MDSLNLRFAESAGVPPAQKNKCRMGFVKGAVFAIRLAGNAAFGGIFAARRPSSQQTARQEWPYLSFRS